MKKLSYFLTSLIFISLCSCQENQNDEISENQTQSIDPKELEAVINSVNPILESANSRSEIEMISYELVADLETGVVTLLNFQSEPFFPIDGEEAYSNSRIATVYTIECTKGDETTWIEECDGKISCGTKIAKCLEQGGCATICQNPNSFTAIRTSDINFLTGYNVPKTQLNIIKNLPRIDLTKAKSLNTLTSMKVYRFIRG